MGSPTKGELAAQPPPWCKQEKKLTPMIPSELAGFTVHEHCTSLPCQAEISSFRKNDLLAEIHFKPQTFARTRKTRKPQHLLVLH